MLLPFVSSTVCQSLPTSIALPIPLSLSLSLSTGVKLNDSFTLNAVKRKENSKIRIKRTLTLRRARIEMDNEMLTDELRDELEVRDNTCFQPTVLRDVPALIVFDSILIGYCEHFWIRCLFLQSWRKGIQRVYMHSFPQH